MARSSSLYWQAVSIMNPYLSSGTKDIEASSLVLEPLAGFNEKGVNLVIRSWPKNPDGRKRRRFGRPDLDHLEAEAGPEMVGRHAVTADDASLHLAILHPSRRRLRPGRQVRRRQVDRGPVDP
jgi:hypothetical protein